MDDNPDAGADKPVHHYSLLLIEPYFAIAVTAERCDVDTIATLRGLGVRRILVKPFKVKTILETVGAFSEQV